MTEEELNGHLQRFWGDLGRGGAPTVHDLWMEQERVAEADGGVLPTKRDVVDHFAWFFAGGE